jgi:hypothetical protein
VGGLGFKKNNLGKRALFARGGAAAPLRRTWRVLDGGLFTARNSVFVLSNWVLRKLLYDI